MNTFHIILNYTKLHPEDKKKVLQMSKYLFWQTFCEILHIPYNDASDGFL